MERSLWIKKIRESSASPTKSLGQNFLVDDRISTEIVKAAGILSSDHVLEIGPGLGALTEKISERADRLTAVEIDRRLEDPLRALFAENQKVRILYSDFLKLDHKELFWNGDYPNICLSNLPYYAMTPILLKLLRLSSDFRVMVFMVEKVACERIFASPGSKSYGPLSVFFSAFGKLERLFDVRPDSFFPSPHTVSTLLRFSHDEKREDVSAVFIPLVQMAFAQRRKTILNTFSNSGFFPEGKDHVASVLKKAAISGKMRAEELSCSQYAALAKLVEKDAVKKK